MWFYSDKDPKQFLQALWFIAKWIVLGPAISAPLLAAVGFFVAGREGLINGLYLGLVIGGMAGVITAGSRALATWSD